MRKAVKFVLCLAATAGLILLSYAAQQAGLLDFSEPTVFETGEYDDYYYLELNEKQKQAYTAVRESVCAFPAQIEIPALEADELTQVLDALLCDDPYLFMFESCSLVTAGKRNYFAPDYVMNIAQYERTREEVDRIADSIIDALPNGSSFEKEKYIHDYIINTCTYSDKDIPSEATVEGVLLKGSAKCSGYAKTFKLLLEKAEIKSVLVTGIATDYEGSSTNHMWNAVELDGNWCFTDITWNDPLSENGEEYCRHVYFNMNETMLSKTHSGYSFSYPCTESSLYYYIYNNAYYNDYNKNTLLSISELIAKSENGEAEFMFSSREAFDTAADKLFEGEEIYRALETANLKTETKLVTTRVRYSFDYNSNLITVYFKTA